MDLNYDMLPEHIRGTVKRYIEEGVPTGGFLQAVISNDLKESFAQADDINRKRMFDIVLFFYNEAPGPCWGTPERYQDWLDHHADRRAKKIEAKTEAPTG